MAKVEYSLVGTTGSGGHGSVEVVAEREVDREEDVEFEETCEAHEDEVHEQGPAKSTTTNY
jgi:hypothetical protein